MTKWKTKIELPDDSYLPENIDLKDTYFSTYRDAQIHLSEQMDILINWMKNDKSCTKPLDYALKYECEPDGGSITYLILYDKLIDPVQCKFKVIKEEQ